MRVIKEFIRWHKSIFDLAHNISNTTGYRFFPLYVYFYYLRLRFRITPHEYEYFHLYESTPRKVDRFLSIHTCAVTSDGLNHRASKADFDEIAEKYLFNHLYQDFIERDWLYIPESTEGEIRTFLARNRVFLAKLSYSTQGFNIAQYNSAETDPDAFIAEYMEKPVLLEAFIQQHPAMTMLNPTSVNTVRLVTARYKDQVMLVGGCLRCGGKGAFVDNFHHGGVAYPLDVETGIVTTMGRNQQGEYFLRHPSSNIIMPGFQVPNWDIIIDKVRKAAMVSKNVAYIGWDLAVTETGVDFVEGNINYPYPGVIQLDRQDGYYLWKQFKKKIDSNTSSTDQL